MKPRYTILIVRCKNSFSLFIYIYIYRYIYFHFFSTHLYIIFALIFSSSFNSKIGYDHVPSESIPYGSLLEVVENGYLRRATHPASKYSDWVGRKSRKTQLRELNVSNIILPVNSNRNAL